MGKYFKELPPQSKCTRCRERARIPLPSHNARFCPDCYQAFFQRAVTRALKRLRVPQEEPLLVAVSGGKDSLAVWDILHGLGYTTRGLHINLGIDDFSRASREAVERYADSKGLEWSEYAIKDVFGYSLPEVRRRFRGKICAVCGRLKRHFLNRLAVQENMQTVVTGHNLDDEAGRLLGNLIGNRQEHVLKQHPYLPSPHPLIPAKLKPLYRVEIKEILIYCELRGIEPADINCSFSKGATSHTFKQALDFLESEMPGTKRNFLFSYVEGKQPPAQPENDFGTCRECGHPAYADLCGVCSLRRQVEEGRPKKRN